MNFAENREIYPTVRKQQFTIKIEIGKKDLKKWVY
jgi:hypothetical protein